ncbi:MAG: SDR family oxidoreductase [Bauldia sp.]|nr:SDR family oxidoreductase [Bauldia sp.]
MSRSRILVTGATGNTGGAIIARLDAAGIKARAFVRDPAKAAHLASPNIEVVAGDLGDKASLVAAMRGIHAVYLNVVPGPQALAYVDNVIAAAKEAGVSHIVKLSGMNASPQSRSAIIRLHAEGDRRVMESGLTCTILRANSFFQNLLSQMQSIRAEGRFYLPLGQAHQSLVDVADIAAVAVTRLLDENATSGTFDITGPQSLTFREVAGELGKALGRDVDYVPISNEAFRDYLLGVGLPKAAAENVAELFDVFADGSYAGVSDDFERVVGRPPRPYAAFAAELA